MTKIHTHHLAARPVLVAAEPSGNEALVAPDGARVEIASSEDGSPALRVRNREGWLLFEYLPDERRAVVFAPDGDLAFAAEHGSVSIQARDGVSIRGGRALDLSAGRTATLSTDTGPGRVGASVALGARGVAVAAEAIHARAARADVTLGEANFVTTVLHTAVQRAHALVGVFEMRATRIVEQAQDVFRTASGIAQSTAQRLKLTATGALEARGGHVLIEADEDVKVQGDTIRLG